MSELDDSMAHYCNECEAVHGCRPSVVRAFRMARDEIARLRAELAAANDRIASLECLLDAADRKGVAMVAARDADEQRARAERAERYAAMADAEINLWRAWQFSIPLSPKHIEAAKSLSGAMNATDAARKERGA